VTSKIKRIKVDVRFDIGKANMYSVNHMQNPLWFTGRLSDLPSVVGVGVHDSTISVHYSGAYDTVMESIDESKQIITDIVS